MSFIDTIRIVVADDHKLFRSGLISILKDYNDIYIVEEAENGKELVEKYYKYKPDVVLSDIAMPVLTGIEAAKKIKQKNESAKILFLSVFDDEEYIYLTLRSGVLGLISKNIRIDELIYAIKKVYNNEYYFGADWGEKEISDLINKYGIGSNMEVKFKQESLTKREEEILLLINDGYTSSKIAEILNVSKRTVDSHRSHIIQKFNINSLPNLIKFAMKYSNTLEKV